MLGMMYKDDVLSLKHEFYTIFLPNLDSEQNCNKFKNS